LPAVSLSKTIATAVAVGAAVGVRHLNVPVLLRVGRLAIQVRADAANRAVEGSPSWTLLLENDASTWTLPYAVKIAELLESTKVPARKALTPVVIATSDDERVVSTARGSRQSTTLDWRMMELAVPVLG
jgi:hypothetical protein